ncbi:MAG: hypothetical protein OEW15_09795 [Nitrospirota bacterium]|nr:hypothetical protein [Nitrospirota bacterium]
MDVQDDEKQSCSWCGEDLDTIEIGIDIDQRFSQGICKRCIDHFLFQKGVPLRQYLDSLPWPVLVVDGDAVVQMANAQARDMLGKKDFETEEQTSGLVFECAHARLPGGCGRSVHCSGCTIRMSIKRTWETGEPLNKVPATLTTSDPEAPAKVDLLITTYKAGDMVMLRVDRL